jgi:four helix bundle protein
MILAVFWVMPFSFENLEVYQTALNWVEHADHLCKILKGKVSGSLLDQLMRAATSIPLNIAEGNGRWHKREKRQFFWIARGSSFECVSIIQVVKRKGLITLEDYTAAYDLLERISKMLSRLIQSVEHLNKKIVPSS